MCGFVGFSVPVGIAVPDLAEWSRSISHRGPDQAGDWLDQRGGRAVGVGTRRLSIQDLSDAGNQPMSSGPYVLAFNGEIYNHLELRDELIRAGTLFRSRSDTETVLRGMLHWGITETLNRLNGVFALAVFDQRDHSVTLGRDPMGVKPLYYLIGAKRELYFGSELQALRRFSVGRVSRQAWLLFMLFGYVPAPLSLIKDIRKLQGGEIIHVDADGRVRQSYIQPTVWQQSPEMSVNRTGRTRQIRDAVLRATRRQLLSDVPVGLFLSGGIDSSIVAASLGEGEHHAFTIKYGGLLDDHPVNEDTRLAKEFAQKLGLDHHEVEFGPDSVTDGWSDLISRLDEPTVEPNALGQILMARRARQYGVHVVLTGDGADEVFLGYSLYPAILKGQLYDRIPVLPQLLGMVSQIRRLSDDSRENLRGVAKVWRKSAGDRFWIMSALLEMDHAARLTGYSFDEAMQVVQGYSSSVQQRAVTWYPLPNVDSDVDIISRMNLLSQVSEHYNPRLDKTTMAASVEARVPFLDLELINLALRLPRGDKFRGDTLKACLRDAFLEDIPKAVIERKKQKFQAPIFEWLQGPLSSWVNDRFGHLDNGGQTLSSTNDAYQLWATMVLDTWCDNMSVERPEGIDGAHLSTVR